MNKAVISGSGLYVPGEPISGDEVRKLTGLEFDTERIAEKTGIINRHIAHLRGIDETTADFATKAATAAIEDAGLSPDDIDLFIVGSDTPEYITPSCAVILQGRLQGEQHSCGAFDVTSSCASFTTALDVGARMTASDPEIQHAVIVGAYNMPAYFRPDDAFGYSMFADGAGAVVLSKTDDDSASGYLTGHQITDGTQWGHIGVYTGGTRQPMTQKRLDSGDWGLQMLGTMPKGRKVGQVNIDLWPPIALHLAEKAGVSIDEVDYFIFTQLNATIIREVMEILGQPEKKALMVMDKYGYTGSGCVPMALDDSIKNGKVKKGDLIVTVASGSGLSVAGNIFRI